MLVLGMTSGNDAKFVISAARRQGQGMGYANHNGDLVEELGGALKNDFDAALSAATELAARLGQSVYVHPLLFGEIDVDAQPIHVLPPTPQPE